MSRDHIEVLEGTGEGEEKRVEGLLEKKEQDGGGEEEERGEGR